MNWAYSLRHIGLALLATMLIAGPFFQGLFFWTQLLAAIAVVAMGFLLWLAGRRLAGLPAGLPGGVPGWALLALLACYLVQFAWAVYPRGNLDWLLRVAAAWFAYSMVRAEAGPRLRQWLGWGIVLSAASVAILGFMEYTGYLLANPELAEALSVVGLQTRMFTVLQYPNTAATFLLASIFALTGLALEDLRPWRTAFEGAVLALLALAFFFSLSRGAVVILPFGLLLLLVGLPRGRRWPAALLLLAAFLPVVATMKPIGAYAAVQDYVHAFQWVALGTGLGLMGGLLVGLLLRLRPQLQVGLGLAAVVGVAALLVAVRPADGYLPAQAARLLDINFRTPNVVSRLVFDWNALEITADHPLGRGGMGWERTYRQYQEIAYTANETHNHYLQTAVEAGLPGLVALCTALLAALWAAWRNRDEGPLGWSLAAGAGVIAGHSLIDFDLSYALIWLLMWVMLAAAVRPAKAYQLEWPAGAAGALVAVLAGVLMVGSHYTDRAEALSAEGRLDEAKEAAQVAVRFDRWDSRPLLVMDDRAAVERAATLDPSNYHARFQLAILLERDRDFEAALREARAALEAYPLASVHWTKVASIEGAMMVDALHQGDLGEARVRAESLVALGQAFAEQKAESDGAVQFMSASKLQMGDEFKLRYGQALYLVGDWDGAEQFLVEASEQGLLGSEGEVWLYALNERQGNVEAMKALEGRPWVRFRGQNPVYQVLKDWQS